MAFIVRVVDQCVLEADSTVVCTAACTVAE